MDRLAEQVVAWHNSHPLAKRISIYDVHTIGVVALPFMRSGSGAGLPGAGPRGQVEPVLTDAVSTESLAAWGTEESTIAANTNAAHLDALADQEEPPPDPARKTSWRERLLGLFRRKSADDADNWPAFSERFVETLSTSRVARFARQHGYTARPGDASWPHRVVPIDDQMMTRDGTVGGAWPFEMYLMSAAIDAGRSRTRILAGRSAGAALPPIIGRRCLSAQRVGLVALIPLCVMSATGAALWQRSAGHGDAAMAAASAPAAAVLPASAVLASAVPASAAPAAASAPAASEALAAAASAPASAVIPDIRPRFVETARPPDYKAPPLLASVAPPAASPAVGAKPAMPTKGTASPVLTAQAPLAAAAPASEVQTLPITPVKPDIQEAAFKGTPVVALVAPPMRNKAEAEAVLARMRELVRPLQPDPALMQAQLVETPEGWRAAVWPFSSRIEAQLINATLVARGLHTKAVNF